MMGVALMMVVATLMMVVATLMMVVATLKNQRGSEEEEEETDIHNEDKE